MKPVTPVKFTTPDGVERELRATMGARKLIHDAFGCNMFDALKKHGDDILPDILYFLMHDQEGNPPPNITATKLRFSMIPEDAMPVYSSIMAAFSQGSLDPNEIEALFKQLQTMEQTKEATNTGSNSGDGIDSASESQIESSGGDTLNANSAPSPQPSEEQSVTEQGS